METENKLLNRFLTRLRSLPDLRRGAGQRHKQEFVLMLVMLATMSGYLGYRAIGDFITKHRSVLLKIFKPAKDRVPSFSTARRILIKLDPASFLQIYQDWLEDVAEAKVHWEDPDSDSTHWCGVDGKAIRGANQMSQEDHVHLVSIFSVFEKIVLDSEKVEDKSNEIPCVQKMIQASDFQDIIFTLDALHCQKKRLKPS